MELLERASVLDALGGLLAEARAGRGRLVLVGGEAGVGKTTLLRRFCEQLGQSARMLWGACDPLFTPSPLGPLLGVAEGSGGELAAVVERSADMALVTSVALAPLGVTRFGQSGDLGDVYRHHEIDAETISENLYTAGIPDPDLLIRTSGEMRLSNFFFGN